MGELTDSLIRYADSDFYPFHMPGHKRNFEFPGNPYKYDITEIEGFDDLHNAEGILQRLQQRAAQLYGADAAYISVNGSTAGMLTAVSAAADRGSKILLGRNTHKSVYNGVFLNEMKCGYIYPQNDKKTGISYGISVTDVEKCLNRHPDARAVLITSPTYEGIVSDIKAISEKVHDYGIPLVVDAAHGAHFGFDKNFPENPVKLGADIVVMSLHKTLPALTQTALICIKGDRINREKIKKYFDIYTTSSPSYLLMSSAEYCFDYLEKNNYAMKRYSERLDFFYKECKPEKIHIFRGDDKGKIIISVADADINGSRLAETFRKKYHIEPEMVSSEYVVFMTSPCDTEEGFKRLSDAVMETDGSLKFTENNRLYDIAEAEVYCTISDAEKYPSETVRCEFAAGRVSHEFVYVYPPGIPILTPGEVISREILELIREYDRNDIKIRGTEPGLGMKVCITEG